jgi:hypothetical protein
MGRCNFPIVQNLSMPCRLQIHTLERLHAGLSDRENLLVTALIIIHLIPIWTFKYFPSQDGPAHINNAKIIHEYHHRTVFREYYILNKDPVPNWFGHLVMAGLMYFMPALVAEKVLLSGYVILLPISIRYVLRTIRPDTGFLTILAFPFIYNFLFHMGFYNFSYSLAMFFFAVGYWLKHRERFTLRETIILTTLSLVLYFCHIVSLVTAYVAIGLLAAWLMFFDLGQQIRQQPFSLRVLWTALWTRVLVPLCALLPALVLVATFLLQKGTARAPAPPAADLWESLYHFAAGVYHRVSRLYHLASLISYDEREGWFSTAFVWLFIVVMGYLLALKVARHQASRWDGLLLVVAGYIVIYCTAPETMSGGGFISHRMNLYPFLALILWFGAQSYHRIVKWGMAVVATGIALALLGLHVQKYAELNDYLGEYLSGTHLIEPNTTLLPLIFSPRGNRPDGQPLSSRVEPFINASGHIAAQRGVVDLANYEAMSSVFPVMFRPHLDPFVHILYGWYDAQFQPPQLDFQSYPQRTGGHVGYVLVWRTREESQDHPVTRFYRQLEQSIYRQLAADYELIYTSPQRGFLQLYGRKERKR